MNNIVIWSRKFSTACLSENEKKYLQELPQDMPSVDWVWKEMDRVWDSFDLNNKKPLMDQAIGEFYNHPVWIMNGIFSSRDPVSVGHRVAIANYLEQEEVKSIADYGGGFGELACAVTRKISVASVTIVEPYPSKVGLEQIRDEERIKVVPDLSIGSYDAIVAQDVLEHIDDPIKLAYEIAAAVHIGGKVIFANCFYPVIQCHLPSTFHLRSTFPYVMKSLGLRYIGKVEGAAHALVFERVGKISLSNARRAETISRLIGPVLNLVRLCLSVLKRALK
jgi:hypothetical protein